MISAIDTTVILDVITEDKKFAQVSENAIRKASREGKLIICECVVAEIFPAFNDEKAFLEFLKDWELEFIPSTLESALLAGNFFSKYLGRTEKTKRVLPDFLIGAHALIYADRLIARDRGYLRDYFTKLKVVDPAV